MEKITVDEYVRHFFSYFHVSRCDDCNYIPKIINDFLPKEKTLDNNKNNNKKSSDENKRVNIDYIESKKLLDDSKKSSDENKRVNIDYIESKKLLDDNKKSSDENKGDNIDYIESKKLLDDNKKSSDENKRDKHSSNLFHKTNTLRTNHSFSFQSKEDSEFPGLSNI